MKIDGKTPTQGPDGRRFPAGKSAAKAGGKSFGAELKKAAAALSAPANPLSAPAVQRPDVPVESATPSSAAAAPEKDPAQGSAGAPAEAVPAVDEGAAFADHMELVKLRLKSGYYASKTVDDALSDRLTGFFDELA